MTTLARKHYTSNNTNHYSFGGEITIEDFNTYSPNKKRINNQADASMLYYSINKKQKERNEEKQYMNMTFEQLKELKLISNTNGRPTSSMTDEKWQREFRLRKMFITPCHPSIKKVGGLYSRESGHWNEETQGTYHGATNWQDYCRFMNDVLSEIRSGHVDVCYYIYQIEQLLKFHYKDLRTKYCDGYWEVWLER